MKRMLINVKEPEERCIVVTDEKKLEAIYLERASSLGHVGNIYKGKVVNIEPSIQAAFIDIGENRNGFLHVSDVMPVYGEISDHIESAKLRKKERKIQGLLTKGANVLVQITKEGIGNKAPTLTTYLSLPGRYIVLMPSIKKAGISRKIEDENMRKKLKSLLAEIAPPPGMGYIVRTAGEGKAKKELAKDLEYLLGIWKLIVQRARYAQGPTLIYQESDLVVRTLRDIFTESIEEIIVDTEIDYKRVLEFMKSLSPDYESRVKLYDGDIPLFYQYGIEEELDKIYLKRVPLSSGGHLVIEQTEALVAIDVNSGKYTDEKDIERTAFKINLEAADEIARQLRLRDLGGVIINDFIDMQEIKHKRSVERVFRDAIRKDRARTRVGRISQFGIIEMTRQRLGPSIRSYTHNICSECNGQGCVKSLETMGLTIIRRIKLGIALPKVAKIILTANPEVISYVLERKREDINKLEQQSGKHIILNSCESVVLDTVTVEYFNQEGQTIDPKLEISAIN